MRILILIPARMGASRFPGKPLALIRGRPMIEWVWERVHSLINSRSSLSLQVVVATDDHAIQGCIQALGGQVVLTPSDLPSGTDRIWAAYQQLDPADLIVNVQGDEPMIDPRAVDQLIEFMLQKPHFDMGTLVTNLTEQEHLSLNVVKCLLNKKGQALYFSRLPIPFSRQRQYQKDVVFKHIGIYAYRPTFLAQFCAAGICDLESAEALEQLRALDLGGSIGALKVDYNSHGVDTPEDIARVEALMDRISRIS